MTLGADVYRLVGKVIGQFIDPVDILLIADPLVNETNDLYEHVRVKGQFSTRLEAVKDLWEFYQPELESQILFFKNGYLVKRLSRFLFLWIFLQQLKKHIN